MTILACGQCFLSAMQIVPFLFGAITALWLFFKDSIGRISE